MDCISPSVPPLTALDSLLDLQKKAIRCDVTFVIGPDREEVSSNILILIARSPVFAVMFEDRWVEENENGKSNNTSNNQNRIKEVAVLDVEPGIFRSFLEFVYADHISFEGISEIEKMLYVAEKYGVEQLIRKCEELLLSQVKVENAIEIHSIADKYNLHFLQDVAMNKMIRKLSKFVLDPSFESMEGQLLKKLLSTNGIVVDEVDLFTAVIRWAEFQCTLKGIENSGENIRRVLGESLAHIRFPLMSPTDFGRLVVPRNILSDKEKLKVFQYIALENKEDRQKWDRYLHPFSSSKRIKLMAQKEVFCLDFLEEGFEVDTALELKAGEAGFGWRSRLLSFDKRILIHGVSFVGPSSSSSFYDVSVNITNDSHTETYGMVEKRVFSKKHKLIRIKFDEPIEPKINAGNRLPVEVTASFVRIHYDIKGPNLQHWALPASPHVFKKQLGGVNFQCLIRRNCLAEIYFTKI